MRRRCEAPRRTCYTTPSEGCCSPPPRQQQQQRTPASSAQRPRPLPHGSPPPHTHTHLLLTHDARSLSSLAQSLLVHQQHQQSQQQRVGGLGTACMHAGTRARARRGGRTTGRSRGDQLLQHCNLLVQSGVAQRLPLRLQMREELLGTRSFSRSWWVQGEGWRGATALPGSRHAPPPARLHRQLGLGRDRQGLAGALPAPQMQHRRRRGQQAAVRQQPGGKAAAPRRGGDEVGCRSLVAKALSRGGGEGCRGSSSGTRACLWSEHSSSSSSRRSAACLGVVGAVGRGDDVERVVLLDRGPLV